MAASMIPFHLDVSRNRTSAQSREATDQILIRFRSIDWFRHLFRGLKRQQCGSIRDGLNLFFREPVLVVVLAFMRGVHGAKASGLL
jgi:hypothetical protein